MTSASGIVPSRSPIVFRAVLAFAFFCFVWGAKLFVIDRFGSDLPFWDQWSKEGDLLLPAWLEGRDVWRQLFLPHNEHRIVPTLMTNLGLVMLSGQWDARVQCMLSAGLHAGILTALFLWALRRLPRAHCGLVGVTLVLIGALPLTWENLLGGFQSQFYFLIAFSLAAIAGLSLSRPLSWRWWGGLASAAGALLSMGSGFLCALPILALVLLRLLRREGDRRDSLVTLLAAGAIVAVGLWLRVSVPGHAGLQAPTVGAFFSYALHCLSWPLVHHAALGLLLWLPWCAFLALRLAALRRRASSRNDGSIHGSIGDFVLAGGGWILLQIAAVSYSRGGSGELPANRYGDVFALGLVFSSVALALLASQKPRYKTAAIGWSALVAGCLLSAVNVVWDTSLQLKRQDHRAYERSVRHFLRTDDLATFERETIPFPNADWLARILRHPRLRDILPASVRTAIPIPGLGNDTPRVLTPNTSGPVRTVTQPGEWASGPLAPQKGWWKFEVAGGLSATGTSLRLLAAADDRTLASITPSRADTERWQSITIPAPREPARLVAHVDRSGPAVSFTEPVAVSALSYWSARLCRRGAWIAGLGALAGLSLGISVFRRSRPGPRDNSLSGNVAFGEDCRFQMKFFTVTALLMAALFSAVVAVPFLPAAKTRPDLFVLEARLRSTVDGTLQVYYDDGAGLREELSARTSLVASGTPATYRLPLPPGTYQALRLDPLDRSGSVTLESLRVLSPAGRIIAEVPFADFKPTNQIQTLALRDRALEIVTTVGSDDPQIAITFRSPIVVHASWRDYVRGSLVYVLPIFVGLAIALFALDRAPRFQAAVATRARSLVQRPILAVGFVAAVAVILSAYPVVFLGKSYVSPNMGTILLYNSFPTLPGYKSGDVVDVKLSDIGAVMWQHVPFSMVQHRGLAQGELPLWNRYNAAGVPLLAQGQSMFGDPLHLLVIAANGESWAWDAKYLGAKWLFATGLGLTVLAILGRWSMPRPTGTVSGNHALPAALIVAGAAPFIGFFLYRINHPAFFSLCYAPWPLYCLIRLAGASTRRGLALSATGLIAANLALMNSGTVKEAYMLLVCINFSGACVIVAGAVSWSDRIVKVAVAAWAGVIFVLLTAPIWATFLQTLKNAYTGYNAVSAYQIQPTLLLGAFDEIFYRPLMSRDQVFSPSLNFLLLLGVLYFLATLRVHFTQRTIIALAASSLLPLSLAFGLVSPQWVVTLPFLGNIAHLDNTFSCVLIVLWSVIAGVGFATAAKRVGTPEGRHDLIVGGLLLGVLVFGWIAFRQASHRPIFGPIFTVNQPGQVLAISPFIWDYLIALLIAAVVLAVLLHCTLARRTFTAARGLLIALCVATLLWRHGLHAGSVGFEPFTARPTERVDFSASSEAMNWTRTAHLREPGRGFGFQGNFFPGWTGVYGLETVHGPDALVNPWLRELVGVSGVERLWDWRLHAEAANVEQVRPFFDALNVRFYFDLASKHPALAKNLTLVKSADLDVYESPTAWPRAYFTDRIDTYEQPAQLVEKIRAANGRPLAAMQRSDAAANAIAARIPGEVATRQSIPATEYRLTENTTSFKVRASGPGAIVLTEAFWPGDFRAEVNARKATVVRLNHAFKGVIVDVPGEYTVTFRYWPRNFLRNLLLCGLGAVLLAASLIFALRRARTV